MEKKTLKEEFYKYGKSLGISINDLQRLMLLSKQQQQQEQQGYSEEDMREAIVKSALSNIDNMIERCDKIIEQFKNK